MKIVAGLLIAAVLIVLVAIFSPVIQVEIAYTSDRVGSIRYVVEDIPYNTFVKILKPINSDFSIIIPKIAATAPIIKDVDSQNEIEYLKDLKLGVAHAKGSAVPGDAGNVYLFAHASDTFYNVPKYNAVFFLLGKLTQGDEIYIYYKDRQFKYIVDTIKVVSPGEVNYLAGSTDKNTLTIQTGYPAGTTFKRLLVIANEIGLQ